MTEPPVPGDQLVVTRRHALMRGLGWPLLALGVVIAVLAALLVLVLVRAAGRDDVIGELACQVQQLGGEPVDGVSCPPTPRPHAPSSRPASSPRAAASAQPSPERTTIVIVMPDGSTRTVAASPAPAASPATRSTSAASSPRPRASPSLRATPSPSPIAVVCLPAVRCFPRSSFPATKENRWRALLTW